MRDNIGSAMFKLRLILLWGNDIPISTKFFIILRYYCFYVDSFYKANRFKCNLTTFPICLYL